MGSLIVGGARTPIGKLLGGLPGSAATDLGGYAIAAALERSGVGRRTGRLCGDGPGAAGRCGPDLRPARPRPRPASTMSVPALTINKVCLSGLNAVALADQLIRAGECEVVVAGGMESMTLAPAPAAEVAGRVTSTATVELLDHMAYDGLWDAFTDQAMGALTEACNTGELQVSRADQDAFAARSHQRAVAAVSSGVMAEEIVEVRIPQRRGDDLVVAVDEGVRQGVTAESLSSAAPGLRPGRDDHRRLGQPDLRRSGGPGGDQPRGGRTAGRARRWPRSARTAWWPGPDSSLQLQPANAIRQACKKQGIECRRPGPDRDQRGVRRRRGGQCPGPRAERGADRGAGQRQRRGHRPGSSDRRVWGPAGPDPGVRARGGAAAAPGWPPCAGEVARATP